MNTDTHGENPNFANALETAEEMRHPDEHLDNCSTQKETRPLLKEGQ